MVSHPLVRPSSKFKSPHQQCSGRSGPEGNWLRFLVNYEAERSIVGRSSRLLMGTPLTLAVVSVSWSDGKIAAPHSSSRRDRVSTARGSFRVRTVCPGKLELHFLASQVFEVMRALRRRWWCNWKCKQADKKWDSPLNLQFSKAQFTVGRHIKIGKLSRVTLYMTMTWSKGKNRDHWSCDAQLSR